MKANNYILGLDIGIASVGYGIVDVDTNKVIDAGVRLFESADASKNEERRSFRGIRRVQRRRKHRLHRVTNFLNNNGLYKEDVFLESPLILKNKGLKNKLSKEELFSVLYNYAKHRGVSYLEDLEDDSGKKEFSATLLENQKRGLPCELQLEKLLKYNKYRGTFEFNDEININTYTISAYEKEIKSILETQKKFYDFITDEFVDEFIKIFKSKRNYETGPGNELSRTNYGIYKTDGTTKLNLFDELRGTCSIYNGKNGMDRELRASGFSYEVQYYNLLNDLNNIKIDGVKLKLDEKNKIINEIKESKSANVMNIICKVVSVKKDSVKGARVDKNEKPIFHSLESYRKFKKALLDLDIDIDKYSMDEYNALSDILTLNTEVDSIKTALKNSEDLNLSDNEIEALINFRRDNTGLFKKWHSFSYRLMREIVPMMEETGDEQQTCLTNMNVFNNNIDNFVQYDEIPIDEIIDEIYNPIVTRSVRQTIKITNALIKKYGNFKDIVIEMAREKNDDDKRKWLIDTQKKNEDELKKAIIFAGLENVDLNPFYKQNKSLDLKLKLYYRQGGICLYSGKPILVNDLLNDFHAYEIDHIIPISVSFNDSQANKVLVYSGENQKKGNKTAYSYILEKNDSNWDIDAYKATIMDLYSKKLISKNAKNNFLFNLDITKFDVIKGFIERNINDTRYASKVVLNSMQSYFRAHGNDTKVKVINGSFTSQFRKKYVKLDKDRDKNHAHHGIDALICCYSSLNLERFNNNVINIQTGEIVDMDKYKTLSREEKKDYLFGEDYYDIRCELENAEEKMKFSHKIDSKVNRGVSNQTIYGTRKKDDEIYVVSKIKDIYNDNEYTRFKKMLDKNNGDAFLMKQHDPQTWDILMKVINQYPESKNPFASYKKEFGYIKKYSKKNNGANIISLKFLENKLGKHIDITNNYKNGNMVVLQSLKPFRADVYYDIENNRFNLVPIQTNDFKFVNGKYILPKDVYSKLLFNEGLIKENETYKDVTDNNHEFRFSLYKNDIILIGNESEVNKYRFLAKNHATKNYFEIKPLNKKEDKQKHIGARRDFNIFIKINTDILGVEHKTTKERLKLEFKVDNNKIKC